jgi:hypothetical protein
MAVGEAEGMAVGMAVDEAEGAAVGEACACAEGVEGPHAVRINATVRAANLIPDRASRM